MFRSHVLCSLRTPRSALHIVLVLAAILVVSASVSAESTSSGDERTLQQLSQAIDAYRGLAEPVTERDVMFHRDPFQALVDEQGHLVTSVGLYGGFSVQGIVWSHDRPLAVIDDQVVAQGETIGSYTILQIRSDGVVVQHNDQTTFIPVNRVMETSDDRAVDPATTPSESVSTKTSPSQ